MRTLEQSIKELKSWIDNYLDDSSNIEKLHKIRTRARRVRSLIDDNSKLYSAIKEIMDRSSKIRDIDVFLSQFLEKLPSNLKQELIHSGFKSELLNLKAHYKSYLVDYLQSLNLNNFEVVESNKFKKESKLRKKVPKLSNKKLHKFRKEIKRVRYSLENSKNSKRKDIKKLKKLQDKLGDIHDNYEGLKLIKKFTGKSNLYKKIKQEIKQKNKKLYKNSKKIFKELS